MSEDKPRLGFIGLGLMGSAMAEQLLAAGYPLTVWNREPEAVAAFAARGAQAADSPAAVAGSSEIVLLCVSHAAAVEAVTFGPQGIATVDAGPRLVIDHSTAEPLATAGIAARLAAATGAEWVDAPVSGGPDFARVKKLTVMCGGTADAFAAARGVMAAYARNVTLMGPPGAGQMAKVLNQAISGVSYVLMAEVLRLAEASGIEAGRIPECLSGGHADSTMLHFAYPRMLARSFEPPASLAGNVLKDLHGVLHEAERFGVKLPLVAAATARFEAFAEAGGARQDTSALYRIYEEQ
jgi:3-hydroxyisobutyrate dehydrogenase